MKTLLQNATEETLDYFKVATRVKLLSVLKVGHRTSAISSIASVGADMQNGSHTFDQFTFHINIHINTADLD